jgi:alpha-L-arabinofuranosidase
LKRKTGGSCNNCAPDLKATHTFGDDKKVRPATRTFMAQVQNNGFNYPFPAHSLTILRLKLK